MKKLLYYLIISLTAYINVNAQCNFKNIGHRGGSSYYYPENTLLSIEQAYIEGAWACEVDVLYTKDSVMILMHDYYVDRTTNGHGNVVDFTLAEIQTLDAGSWKHPRFAGEKIPTLIQAMQLAHQYNKKLYLNMKVYEPQMIAAALTQSGVPPDVIMIDPDEIYKVLEYHTLMPNTPLVYFGAPPDPITDTIFYQTMIANNVIAVELFAGDILDTTIIWTSQFRDFLHSYGLELWAYTVNDNGYLNVLKNFGIDGLETDRPTEAKNIFCYNQAGGFFPEKRITGQWDFTNHNLDATIGSQLIERGDTSTPEQHAIFGTTDEFGIPSLNGVITDIMKTPAYDASHNLVFFSNIAPQGNPGGIYCDNDYTLIIDILKPASVQTYISLFQTSNNNSDDGDLFIRITDSTIGITGTYLGTIEDSIWYRLAAVFDLPNQILNLYLNGNSIGTIPLINSLDGRFCLNNNWGIQPSCLFSDDDGETSQLYVSSIQIRDYAMTSEEIAAMGEATSFKIPIEILIPENTCPAISDTSENISICEGTNINLSVNAGDTVNYRWQVNKGNGWIDISEMNYSQSANDTLHIITVDTSMNTNKYRCMISTDCVAYSQEISLNILLNPHANIILNGNSQLCSGDSALLIVSQDTTAHYQWLQNNIIIAVDTSLVVVTQEGNYNVIVTNYCGTDTSATINFIEHESIAITTQPADQNITEGSNTFFYIYAIGEGLQYQWQVDTGTGWYNLTNNLHFINTNTSMLGIMQATQDMDGYRFRCNISGFCNTLISDSAFLNINILYNAELNENLISVFPNPNNGNFQINIPEKTIYETLAIYSTTGEKIKLKNNQNSNTNNISLQLPSGLYILEYQSGRSLQRSLISVIK